MDTTKAYIEIVIPIDSIQLKGNLRHAENSKGIILFSHGSGSSRLSSRNNYVAYYLLKHGFSSLLFDLLTQEEDTIYQNRFDIQLLTDRLVKVTKWIRENSETKHLPIGYFGASTGAASALSAAAQLDDAITAIVSRGGRPDLAMPAILNKINIPTLLLVGSLDDQVIKLNKEAQKEIRGICELKIIQGASHLFEERGKLEIVSKQTSDWFDLYMSEKTE